jgi:hypothetical protein
MFFPEGVKFFVGNLSEYENICSADGSLVSSLADHLEPPSAAARLELEDEFDNPEYLQLFRKSVSLHGSQVSDKKKVTTFAELQDAHNFSGFNKSFVTVDEKAFVARAIQGIKSDLKEAMLSSLLGKKVEKIYGKILEIPHIVSPSFILLQRVAEYYKSKYEIDISLVKRKELAKQLSMNLANPVHGVIVTDDCGMGHVCPILLDNIKKQAIIMDVRNDKDFRHNRLALFIVPTLNQLGYDIFITSTSRQVDLLSCRTEAMSILRNMLLYHKLYEGIDLDRFVVRASDGAPKQKIFEAAVDVSYTRINLPPECDYIDQITRKDPGLDLNKAYVIRNFFSSKPIKRESKESYIEFRKRCSANVHAQSEHRFYIDLSSVTYSKEDISGRIEGGNYRLEIWDQKINIITEQMISICAYQYIKGHKNAYMHSGEVYPIYPVFESLLKHRQEPVAASSKE